MEIKITFCAFAIFFLIGQSNAQKKLYRVKVVSSVDFIIPPKAKVAFEGIFNRKTKLTFKPGSKYKYHYVVFTNIPKKPLYYQALESVNKADYFYRDARETPLLKGVYCQMTGPTTPTRDGSTNLFVSGDGSCLAIEIDYDILFSEAKRPVPEAFQKMALALLAELYKKEALLQWPASISQTILEKVFELIPVPAETILSRYAAVIDDDKSFVLLNPRIKFKVDTVDMKMSGSNWKFDLVGGSTIQVSRNDRGEIIQNPFHQFQVKTMPDNSATYPAGKTIHQASHEDIQLSETLKSPPFLFLYQNSGKPNSGLSRNGVCSATYLDSFNCNAMLWHFTDLSAFYSLGTRPDLEYEAVTYISSYGLRNFIIPFIEIAVNGNYRPVPLNAELHQWKEELPLPTSFKLYRMHRGSFVRMRIVAPNKIILLPHDKIEF